MVAQPALPAAIDGARVAKRRNGRCGILGDGAEGAGEFQIACGGFRALSSRNQEEARQAARGRGVLPQGAVQGDGPAVGQKESAAGSFCSAGGDSSCRSERTGGTSP